MRAEYRVFHWPAEATACFAEALSSRRCAEKTYSWKIRWDHRLSPDTHRLSYTLFQRTGIRCVRIPRGRATDRAWNPKYPVPCPAPRLWARCRHPVPDRCCTFPRPGPMHHSHTWRRTCWSRHIESEKIRLKGIWGFFGGSFWAGSHLLTVWPWPYNPLQLQGWQKGSLCPRARFRTASPGSDPHLLRL